MTDRHWQHIWSTKSPTDVSWTQTEPTQNLRWIDRVAGPAARVLDVGGGASVLVDRLLDRGHRPTILDIAPAALDQAKARLGDLADRVEWIVGDVLQAGVGADFDVWHDRAVLHFLTDPADRASYVERLAAALGPGAHAIIATFAPDGPERCSGLPVERFDATRLADLLGPRFALVEQAHEIHTTPWGSEQAFQYVLMRRR